MQACYFSICFPIFVVNNVGMGYEYPDYLENLSVEFCEKMVHVNMLSAVKV